MHRCMILYVNTTNRMLKIFYNDVHITDDIGSTNQPTYILIDHHAATAA